LLQSLTVDAMENPAAKRPDSNRSSSNPFRRDIEGLRAVAVALVIGYHADVPFLSGGVIGVDIFFVVSGYLITSLLSRELDLSGGINLIQFYTRRARRLLPAATLVVVTVCLVEAVLASPLVQYRVLKDAVATMLYSSNIYFSHAKRSYFFPGNPPSPLIHTWSLAVEEQFYIVWPILLLFLARLRASVKLKVLFLASITVVSFAVFLWLLGFSETEAYFQAPARVWEFGAGGLASFVPRATLNRNRNLWAWAGIAGLLALMLSAAFMRTSVRFPADILAIVVVATVAVLLSGAGAPKSLTAGLLKLRPFQSVGAISYSLYLWHWPILTIARNVSSSNSLVLRAGCTIVSVLLAAITYAVIENPIRHNTWLISKPRLSLGIAAVSITICMMGFVGWRSVLIHSGQYRKFQQVVEDVPSFDALNCKADNLLRMCFFDGSSDSVSTVVLLGDSHAAQWLQPMKEIAQTQHWKLVTMIRVGCSPMRIISGRRENPQENELCDQWRTLALAKIREMHPDMVILSSSSSYPPPGSTFGLIDASVWELRSHETFLALTGATTSVRFIRDTPHFDYNVASCLAQREWNGRATCGALLRSRASDADIYEAEVRAGAGIGNLRFIDMTDAIFHGDRLEPERDGVAPFMDGDHMTQRFAGSLAGALQGHLLAGSNR
jgi:peptidoglycan/LPS O-acetylase OafA/YrhL